MGRPKIARKSTIVDMTAMCDVAFLLLTFFILATKFKPSEAVPVSTPKSVASKIAPENDIIMVSMDKDGRAYISTGDGSTDKENKTAILNTVNTDKNLGLTESEIKALVAAPFIGVPMSQLSQQAKMPKDQMSSKTLPGIPIKDTANNEMIEWMKAVHDVYQGQKLNLLLKGDNAAMYPSFKNIIDALKKNDLLKFQMVTNPQNVPEGTDLWKENMDKKPTAKE